ncbi:MAG: hypothetical protein IKM92_00755 [Bacteroidaceae bacterium]|nr:hypothetical protein [Bacteroidaceae bacterium]
MKKLLSVFLALSTVITLISCGNKNSENSISSDAVKDKLHLVDSLLKYQ